MLDVPGVLTVSELIAQAQASEETGDTGQALVLYERILHLLEETPEALDEVLLDEAVTICTRVGDLRVQLRQPARAFASYQQAAEYGARLGSSEHILTLCMRMINVVPAAGDSYARYARRLFEYGHVEPALDVLAAFADKLALDPVREAVATLAGRSSEEQGPVLKELLAQVEREAHGVMLPLPPPPVVASSRPVPAGHDTPMPDRAVPRTKKESLAQERGARAPEAVSRVTRAARHWWAGWGSLGFQKSAWVPIGIAGGIGLVIVWIVAVPDRSSAPEAPAIVASVDTLSGSVTAASADSTPRQETTERPANPPVAAVTSRPPVQSTQPAQQPAQSDPPPAVPSTTPRADTAAVVAPPPVSIPPVSLPDTVDADSASFQPVVAGDLAIVSVSPAAFRGLSGFRVVHRLATGGQFIVESYPVDSNTATAYPLGTVIINVVPPDTTVSIMRFDDQYLVFASGVLPEDSVRVLLRTLRVAN